jgi:hypothetical protein
MEPITCQCLATSNRRLAGVSRELNGRQALGVAVFPNHRAVAPIQARGVASKGDQFHRALRGGTKRQLDADSLLGGNPLPLRGLKERRRRGGIDGQSAPKALAPLVGVQNVARGRSGKSNTCHGYFGQLETKFVRLGCGLSCLGFGGGERHSCFFARFTALQATAASFLSLATFCLASFASLRSAAISGLVEARTPAQLGRALRRA